MTRKNDEDLYSFQTVIPGQMIDNGYNGVALEAFCLMT
jgi:hypothetical protein